MFANPIWSVLILAGLVAVYYFIIRPRLRVAFSETYAHLDTWWERWWARIVAFRSWIATVAAALLIALPDILVAVTPIDLSPFIGEKWAPLVSGALAAFLALNRAFSTTPREQPPA